MPFEANTFVILIVGSWIRYLFWFVFVNPMFVHYVRTAMTTEWKKIPESDTNASGGWAEFKTKRTYRINDSFAQTSYRFEIDDSAIVTGFSGCNFRIQQYCIRLWNTNKYNENANNRKSLASARLWANAAANYAPTIISLLGFFSFHHLLTASFLLNCAVMTYQSLLGMGVCVREAKTLGRHFNADIFDGKFPLNRR